MLVFGNRRVAARHRTLHLDGEGDGIDHAGEFEQHAVAGGLDDAAVMLGYRRIDQFPAMRLERGERPDLVDAHQAAVPDHIGGQNCGEPALHARPPITSVTNLAWPERTAQRILRPLGTPVAACICLLIRAPNGVHRLVFGGLIAISRRNTGTSLA